MTRRRASSGISYSRAGGAWRSERVAARWQCGWQNASGSRSWQGPRSGRIAWRGPRGGRSDRDWHDDFDLNAHDELDWDAHDELDPDGHDKVERSRAAQLPPDTRLYRCQSRSGYLEPDATLIGGSGEDRFAVLIEHDRTDRPHKQIDRLRRYDWWLLEGWRETHFATHSIPPTVIFLTSRERPLRRLVETADRVLSAWYGHRHAGAREGSHPARERSVARRCPRRTTRPAPWPHSLPPGHRAS
jgi:hypothetical protein